MYICEICKLAYTDKINFCPQCGCKLIEIVDEPDNATVDSAVIENATVENEATVKVADSAFNVPNPFPDDVEDEMTKTCDNVVAEPETVIENTVADVDVDESHVVIPEVETTDSSLLYLPESVSEIDNSVVNSSAVSHIIPAGSRNIGNKATAILGMIFGILGLILSGYHLLYVIAFYNVYYYPAEEIAITMFIVGLFMIPFTILGIVMSNKPVSRLQGMARAGKITAFISIGVFALSFFLTTMLFFV